MIRAVILDFDGTLVQHDMLDEACSIVGKQAESERLNKDFIDGKTVGVHALVERINLLRGTPIQLIREKVLENPHIAKGARDLIDYLHDHHIVIIIASGNITPILEAYQQLLGASYIVGTTPQIMNGKIMSITEAERTAQGHKLEGVKDVLSRLGISPQEALAIGDSPADKKVFEFVGTSIAINPKGSIERYATHAIEQDLSRAVPIIKSLM